MAMIINVSQLAVIWSFRSYRPSGLKVINKIEELLLNRYGYLFKILLNLFILNIILSS